MPDKRDQDTQPEGQHLDRKSLRTITGKTADFPELAKDSVCFANGSGGQLLIGIEDDATAPPPEQRVPASLLDRIRKRIGELTVNVDVAAELRTDENGGEYVALTIPRAVGVASTSDGRYFLRIGDDCRPVVGDDVLRLVTERPSVPWETMTSLDVKRTRRDLARLQGLCVALRASDRVKKSVREKTDEELLTHYGLAEGEVLTNLLEDLERFPDSGRADVHRRIGPEIHAKTVTRALNDLVSDGAVTAKGERRWRTYRLVTSKGQNP